MDPDLRDGSEKSKRTIWKRNSGGGGDGFVWNPLNFINVHKKPVS